MLRLHVMSARVGYIGNAVRRKAHVLFGPCLDAASERRVRDSFVFGVAASPARARSALRPIPTLGRAP
jgi:hypothetical protein